MQRRLTPRVSSDVHVALQQILIFNTADICCCTHGGRCACALKKEHLDPVPESDSDEASLPTPPSTVSRPRAHTVQSEGSGLTVFTNGHHKPAHKHNQAAHKCGLPYVVPRAQSIHGASPGGLANRSVDNLPHISTIDALHSDSHIKDSMVSAQQEQRMVKSEHNSPVFGSTNLGQLNGQLPPLDLSNLESFPSAYNFPLEYDGLPAVSDIDQPIFSAGLSASSVDWSHYDLDFSNDNFAASNFSQAASFAGFDFSGIDQPALTTTSTSGEISEVEDFMPSRPSLVTPKYGSDLDNSDVGETDGYRLSTASSYIGAPQAQMLASNDVGSLDIDEFLKGIVTSSSIAPSMTAVAQTTTYEEDSKLTPGAFNDTPFPLAQTTDEEVLWMNDFSTNSTIPYNSGNLEGNGQNVWAQ